MTVHDCPFCHPSENAIFLRSALCYVIPDISPVTRGHVLIIPFRHVPTFFDTTGEERNCILSMVDRLKVRMDDEYFPDGYNIGVNVGEVAGQSIMHTHVHFIPRYRGDMKEVGGGVRRVVSRR